MAPHRGYLNTILARGSGNLNDPIFKSSNARALPLEGGMLKFRVDRRNKQLKLNFLLRNRFGTINKRKKNIFQKKRSIQNCLVTAEYPASSKAVTSRGDLAVRERSKLQVLLRWLNYKGGASFFKNLRSQVNKRTRDRKSITFDNKLITCDRKLYLYGHFRLLTCDEKKIAFPLLSSRDSIKNLCREKSLV